jgi:hypothetical protein
VGRDPLRGAHTIPCVRRRPLLIAAVVAAILVVVAAVVGEVWRERRGRGLPAGAAEWVWVELPERLPSPVAFYAVRDFSLAEAPGGGEAAAVELRLLGDEEYVVWVNGQRVGSNRYAPGAPLDVYRVGDLLLAGPNRLAVELRSSRGAGGLLAALVTTGDEDGVAPRMLLATDESWRVARRHLPGLVEGWVPVPGEEWARSWGLPPTGRWGMPVAGGVRPRLAAVGEPCDPVAAEVAEGANGGGPGRVIFDFGREVTGYLRVGRPPDAPLQGPTVSLFAVADRPVRPLTPGSGALPLVTLPGTPAWTDVVPRRFRYAAVVGLEGPLEASVLPVSPHALAALPGSITTEAADPGLLGLARTPRRLPAEDAVRRRLQKAAEEPES